MLRYRSGMQNEQQGTTSAQLLSRGSSTAPCQHGMNQGRLGRTLLANAPVWLLVVAAAAAGAS